MGARCRPYVECDALIVICGSVDDVVAAVGGGDWGADQASGQCSALLGDLIGVGEVCLRAAPQVWGAEG